ncbi:hypothetical protein [Nitrosopumilus ureiphilus]|uniref:Peptidase S1 n=1 Tax=Nitrosopumilus ureiphilus TaxID=1470067 RepID=A0A7D5M8Z5_9ARCH|nr:hypothetical protein [Nitrosopumilus ureiphilus]QLH06189.1 hypothetical protein C5F50_03165 [Nitrosopumilus ureiphilus]
MITKNAKTILFASLIAAMILPFSMMGIADAIQDNNQRMEAKKQNIANLGDKMQALSVKIFDLEATLANLESEGNVDEQESIKKTLAASYGELDRLQAKAYKLFEIPEKRYQKLLEAKQQILEEYDGTGMIDDIFIDHSDESIQVILYSDYFESHKDTVKSKADSIASKKPATPADDVGNIKVGIKHFTPSAVMASDEACAGVGSGNSGYNQICNKATISFPATKSSVNGFVTVGHALQEGLNTYPSNAINQLPVYQPGPADTNGNGIGVVPTGQSLTDLNWQAQILGTLSYGVYDASQNEDAAFVKLSLGKTVNKEVDINGATYNIASYLTGNPTIGHYVYKSGLATGTTFGFVQSVNTDGVYASYTQCKGDSGSPVGTVLGADFTFYGMHLGTVGSGPFFNQPSCSGSDTYSKFMTYSTIVNQIGVTGQTQ